MDSADKIIQKLGLEPVPDEGGAFVRIYTGPNRSGPDSPSATSILYLLRGSERSRWHKLSSDEIWFYHSGSAACQLLLFPDGTWCERTIGPDMLKGEMPQSIVPAGVWQSTILTDQSENASGMFGTVCIPGFTYAAYTGGKTEDLMKQYPGAAEWIRTFGKPIPSNGINTEG